MNKPCVCVCVTQVIQGPAPVIVSDGGLHCTPCISMALLFQIIQCLQFSIFSVFSIIAECRRTVGKYIFGQRWTVPGIVCWHAELACAVFCSFSCSISSGQKFSMVHRRNNHGDQSERKGTGPLNVLNPGTMNGLVPPTYDNEHKAIKCRIKVYLT